MSQKKSSIIHLVRENIRNLTPYSTARDEYKGSIGIFLDANESPYPSGYNRYPDPHQKLLKEKIGQLKNVKPENIFLGNGSDEPIDLVFRVFCEPAQDNAVMIAPTYGMYQVAATINDVQVRSVPLGNDFSLPTEALLSACDEHTKLMFVCSPNNPTGNAFSADEILHLAERFSGILVVDEAYVDFSTKGSLRAKVTDVPNLVVLQTFSKAWGMAALRLGLAFASTDIVQLMSMVKYPYNINQSTQQIVYQELGNPVDAQVATIVSERKTLTEALEKLSFVQKAYPSDANFLLVKVADADALYNYLLKQEIIVRNRNKVQGCENCVRITIGLKDENKRLIEALEAYEKSPLH